MNTETTYELRTEFYPYGLSDFLDVNRLLDEAHLNSRIEFDDSDILLKDQHRAAYGCPAYQIWHVTETGKAVFNELAQY